MIGKTISHYKILEKIGEGGMGVVYKAEDTTLSRIVVLKFLSPELTHDAEARERFIQEARAASALDHPNICTIHEVSQTEDNRTFIAMAYCEGEDLKRKIERGPLKIDSAIDIAVQIAGGLAKAHGQGIVHRDIKPANVIITKDGLVKIVDFGLAKLAGSKLTKTGLTIGTVQYLSPEAARGEKIDHRTDIWSLGLVLYEMLTGKHAFPREYEQAMLYSIMNEEPEPITALRARVPMELERIVAKALAKKPEERYQHADDFIVDLKRTARESTSSAARTAASSPAGRGRIGFRAWVLMALGAAAAIAVVAYFSARMRETRGLAISAQTSQYAAPVWRDSIAVLPFQDYSAEKDQEHLCDGMTDDVITKLSSIHGLKVISRTSVMRYKKTNKSLGEIARELGVGVVLEGSIQKDQGEIRINVQLIRATDDAHLWAKKYDRKLESIFRVQDEISMAIAEALALKLTSVEKEALLRRPIDNVEAYDCYLKACKDINRAEERAVDRAFQNLQACLDTVGDQSLLYAGMAYACYQYVNIGAQQEEYIDKSDMYAKEALALDPYCHQAYVILGINSSAFRGDQQYAVRQYKKALAINPNYAPALHSLGNIYLYIGKHSLAAALLERYRQINPITAMTSSYQYDIHLLNGEYEAALEFSKRDFEAHPGSPRAQSGYARALIYNKRLNEALPIMDKLVEQNPDNTLTKFMLLLKYGMLKDREKAFQTLTPEFQSTCRRDFEWSYRVAESLSLLGAKREALEWLDNAIDQGFLNYHAMERDVLLDNIRGEEQFKRLLERAKYESDRFEV